VTLTLTEEQTVLSPRPYQIDGINFLQNAKRAMLADAPGLGKTLQAAEAACPYGPILVVAPTYLCQQWYEFLTSQYPTEAVSLATGSRQARQRALNAKAKWYIVNTEMLRSEYYLPMCKTVIFDESHHLRNRDSKQSKAAYDIAKLVDRVYLLTATPIVRDPDDIWHQLHMIDPIEFDSYWDFIGTWFRCSYGRFGTQVIGYKNKAAFSDMVSKYVLGRSYEDVGLYLPDLIASTQKPVLTEKMRKVYNDLRDYYAAQIGDGLVVGNSAIEILHALRFVTANDENKLRHVVELASEQDSFVVFTEYRDSAAKLAQALNAQLINGSVKPADRPVLARNSTRVVCTIDSMSEGMDLSHIHTCIFYEEDYTYGVMHQALSRMRRWSPDGERIGAPVYCFYVHARDTIDETVHAKQKLRTVNAKDVVKAELQRA
jgi:superfamily II DNA or RNA helicase